MRDHFFLFHVSESKKPEVSQHMYFILLLCEINLLKTDNLHSHWYVSIYKILQKITIMALDTTLGNTVKLQNCLMSLPHYIEKSTTLN